MKQLAIVFGASELPSAAPIAPFLKLGRSAKSLTEVFIKRRFTVLNLFDDERSASEQIGLMIEFSKAHLDSDLLVFYCGAVHIDQYAQQAFFLVKSSKINTITETAINLRRLCLDSSLQLNLGQRALIIDAAPSSANTELSQLETAIPGRSNFEVYFISSINKYNHENVDSTATDDLLELTQGDEVRNFVRQASKLQDEILSSGEFKTRVSSGRFSMASHEKPRPSMATGRPTSAASSLEPLIRQIRKSGEYEPSTDHKRESGKYDVWYGTNRKPHDPHNLANGYSSERDSQVHYGRCRVHIPQSHRIGSVGSPWWKRILTMQDDRLKLLSITEMDVSFYWKQLRKTLTEGNKKSRHAVIFVHGYNVSFQDAALRAAQLGFDLSVRGEMAFFSWPSQGSLEGYPADAETIRVSESAITKFMTDFVENSGASYVHIIAHSMGNRGVLAAVERISEQAERLTGKRFGQIILAAADVDSDLFRERCGAYTRVSQQTTLYISRKDRAVEASRWLHKFDRVGIAPPIFVAPGINTIEVANVDMTRLGHGYVAEARAVLEDIHSLIHKGSQPNERFGLRAEKTELGDNFWYIGS